MLSLALHLLGFAYASLLTFLFFRQQFQLKLFAFLLFPSIIILLYDSVLVSTLVFASLVGGYGAVVLAMLVSQALVQFKKV